MILTMKVFRMMIGPLFFFWLTALSDNASMPAHCGLYAYKAEITEVYDGDTVTADVDLGFNTWRRDEKLRLYGIDAPEVRGDERANGLVSRDALRKRVLGRELIVCTIKDETGKYGRYLAELYLGGDNINDWMIAEGYAQPYGSAVQGSMGAMAPDVARLMPGFVYAPLEAR
jgi:micrococcal nuclease